MALRPYTIIPDTNHTSTKSPKASSVRFKGWNLKETAGAPAEVVFRKGPLVSGQPIMFVDLAADETAALVLDKDFFEAEDGVYVEVVAGTIEGVIYDG